jgi:hypothetical protein
MKIKTDPAPAASQRYHSLIETPLCVKKRRAI